MNTTVVSLWHHKLALRVGVDNLQHFCFAKSCHSFCLFVYDLHLTKQVHISYKHLQSTTCDRLFICLKELTKFLHEVFPKYWHCICGSHSYWCKSKSWSFPQCSHCSRLAAQPILTFLATEGEHKKCLYSQPKQLRCEYDFSTFSILGSAGWMAVDNLESHMLQMSETLSDPVLEFLSPAKSTAFSLSWHRSGTYTFEFVWLRSKFLLF